MESLERIKLAAQTEPTIRAITIKARVSNATVHRYLKRQGLPLRTKIKLIEE